MLWGIGGGRHLLLGHTGPYWAILGHTVAILALGTARLVLFGK